MRFSQIRVEPNGLTKTVEGLIEASFSFPETAKVIIGIRAAGIDLEGLLIASYGRFNLSLFLQGHHPG